MTPFNPKTIVAGFDFSDGSTAAVEFANEFALRWSGRVIVVHAPPLPRTPDLVLGTLIPTSHEMEQLEQQARLWMKEVFPPEWMPEIRIVDLDPAKAILKTAEMEQAELIVVGTEGRGGLSRLTLGSVAEQVLRLSDIPVLTVRTAPDGTYPFRRIRHVLCPVNFSSLAGQALEHASEIAQLFGAELTVLHLVGQDPLLDDLDRERERLRVWVGGAVPGGTRLRIRVQRGDAAGQILQYARTNAADLIVVGAQHKRFRDVTTFGSTTERVTRHAHCPVLTVSRADTAQSEKSAANVQATSQLEVEPW